MAGVAVRVFLWVSGAIVAGAGVIFYESFWAGLVKYAGFQRASLGRFIFTLVISWVVIRLASGSRHSLRVREWLSEKEARMSERAKKIAAGGKFLAVINTAIFLGPPIASILMIVLGIGIRRVYLYALLCSLLAAGVWCGLYSGIFWTWGRVFIVK